MVHIDTMPEEYVPDGWIFEAQNVCRKCGATWQIDRCDRPAPFWRYFLGWLRKPYSYVMGPGIVNETMYMVKTYPAESGMPGTFLVSRCPKCGAYCFVRQPWEAR